MIIHTNDMESALKVCYNTENTQICDNETIYDPTVSIVRRICPMQYTDKAIAKLKGKYVQYSHKSRAHWQLGKLKDVILYRIGPKKGQPKEIRIATQRNLIDKKTGRIKLVDTGRKGIMKWNFATDWRGPVRKTKRIKTVLIRRGGKQSIMPIKEWLEKYS